jgi:hypothetical protein
MEPFSTIAAGIISTIASAAAKRAGGDAIAAFTKKKADRARLSAYLQRLTNLNSYFVTYRISRQHIKDAYVEPQIIDGAITRTHISPEQYEIVSKGLSRRDIADERFEHIPTQTRDNRIHTTLDLSYVPLSDLVTSPDDCLVLGDAGDGKSSLLAYLCWRRLNEENPRIPIFLDSRQLRDASVVDLIYAAFNDAGMPNATPASIGGGLSIYVDGLDELPRNKYSEVCMEINQLNAEGPEIQFTVSCRAGAYKGDFEHMREVSIAPFTSQQTTLFVNRWYADVEDGPNATEMLGQINASDRLAELATKPLILALMCSAFRRYLNISRRPTALFNQCIESLIWEWDAKRTIRREGSFSGLDIEKQVWLHSLLAVNLHDSGRRFCDQKTPLAILTRDLPKFGIEVHNAALVLKEIVANHSIFVKWTEDTYGFNHFAIQEFLAALWYRGDRRWERLLTPERISDTWWEYVTAYCIASLDDATEALTRLYNSDGVPELRRTHLAAHSLRYDPIVDESIRNEVIRKILHWYHNGDCQQKKAAIDMLVGMEDDWAAPVIRRSLAGTLTPTEINSVLRKRQTRSSGQDDGM